MLRLLQIAAAIPLSSRLVTGRPVRRERVCPIFEPPFKSMRVRLLVVACVAIVMGGCASTPDPPPPDLSQAMDNTESRIQSLNFSEQAIQNDLARLDELVADLDAKILETIYSDLPLSLLRLVAMNCLNTEYDGYISDVVGIEGTPLSCRPAHIDRLQEALAESSTTARDNAHQLLYLVDQARILRGSLRQRLARIPQASAEHRDFIADERANIRRLDADLNQRRNQYSSSGWRDATAVLNDYRALLHALDTRIDEIAEAYPEWPAELDKMISGVYFGLTDMRNAGR